MNAFLDHPLVVPVFMFALLSAAASIGARLQDRYPVSESERELLRVVAGATLTLLGLIIAFSFSMAINRYEQRKNYEEDETNAIGTEVLRADLLPAPTAAATKTLLKAYVAQRIQFYEERNDRRLVEIDSRTDALEHDIWAGVTAAAAAQPTPILSLAAAGANDVINARGCTRAAWLNRIPEGAWLLMTAIAVSCCGLIGYGAQKSRRLLLIILPLVLATAFFFIDDIESPRHGLIRVVPHNLVSLAETLP